jgi:tRNA U55 pseudouridine synthase TruB
MTLLDKAFKILQTDKFSRKRYMAAMKLYRQAEGQEKDMIGELFESQVTKVENLGDLEWIAKVAPLFNAKG